MIPKGFLMRLKLVPFMLCAALPLAALADTETTAAPSDADATAETTLAEGAVVRPGDADAQLPLSDGMAECAAILAVASTMSRNIIDSRNLTNSSAAWFAASGDVATEEGALPDVEVWGEKVQNWSLQIGSMDALSRHADWMTYCAATGQQQGLGTAPFSDYAG